MMKKRLLCILLAAVLLLLCGCDRLSTAENLIGTWRSEDGYTVTFTGSSMILCDDDGDIADGFPASYLVLGNTLHLRVGQTMIEAFECRTDGDSLTLIYTDSFLKLALGSADKEVSISLTRCYEY